jgi:beta-glucanase (GH16 family)
MDKNHWFAIGVAWSLAAAPLPALAGNVLTNPGFESDPPGQSQNIPGWTLYGANTYNETGSTAAHTGSNYFKVYQAFNGVVNYNGIHQDYISGPGASYTADGWAQTMSSDTLAGGNVAWMEVTFRDANANTLALYRSSLITTNAIATGAFPKSAWIDLPVTNQYNPNTLVITNTTRTLTAPPGAYFVRFQVVFQGDAAYSAGSVYFDDLNLNLAGAPPYGDWNIVWSDEFNGTAINTATWTFETGNNGGWGNNELEYYTSNAANAYVSNGLLHITALPQATNGFSFTSARMKTEGLVSWLYGRFEWRARLPAGAGFWPALWFLGTNITSVGWPDCGEMDVMENNGAALTNVQGSLHSGSDETAVYTLPNGESVTSFHTYVLDWAANSFLWYVDGHLYEMQTNWSSSLGAYPAPFNEPCFMLMNLAVGGSYVGYPSVATIDANGGFPGDMQVDYVRVYNTTPPLQISVTRTNNSFLLSWPGNIIAHLQAQLTPANHPMTTNWSDVTPSPNPFLVNPTNSNAFYRLESP